MKRYSQPFQLCLFMLMLVLAGCSASPLRNSENICDIFEEKRDWYKASLKAQHKWGNPLEVPMAIMYQESAFRKRARPPRKVYLGFIPGRRKSTAYGYAQVIDGTWKEYMKTTGQYWRERNNFVDALDFVHYYINRTVRINGIARNDAYHQYLNYHEGTTGFKRGSHKKKPFLLKAANKVQQRSNRYAGQFSQCADDLKKGWFSRLLGR